MVQCTSLLNLPVVRGLYAFTEHFSDLRHDDDLAIPSKYFDASSRNHKWHRSIHLDLLRTQPFEIVMHSTVSSNWSNGYQLLHCAHLRISSTNAVFNFTFLGRVWK